MHYVTLMTSQADMTDICELVTTGDAVTGYVAAQEAINHFTEECLDVNYADMISEMQNTSLASDVAGTILYSASPLLSHTAVRCYTLPHPFSRTP
jgi:hypothetical protein